MSKDGSSSVVEGSSVESSESSWVSASLAATWSDIARVDGLGFEVGDGRAGYAVAGGGQEFGQR